jgi:hypothetical protein
MTDISITAANVVPGSDAVLKQGRAGETIAAGKAVYLDATALKWKLADSNSVVVGANKAGGIAVNGASLNQPITVQTFGEITIGGTLVAGSAYYLSETPGGIQPGADLATENVCLLGLAKSATVLALNIQTPGVVLT